MAEGKELGAHPQAHALGMVAVGMARHADVGALMGAAVGFVIGFMWYALKLVSHSIFRP